MKICPNCGIEFEGIKRQKFCGRSCISSYNAKYTRWTKHNILKEELLEEYGKNPKKCLCCGDNLSYEKRLNSTCSMSCSNRMRKQSTETREKISDTLRKNGIVPLRPHKGGRYYAGWYKGIVYDSSWELAFIIYHLDHNIEFERNSDMFKYTYQGKVYNYFPDFKKGDKYIEIKGFESFKDKYKWKVVSNLQVMFYDDVKIYLDYVELVYGKDFHKTLQDS